MLAAIVRHKDGPTREQVIEAIKQRANEENKTTAAFNF